MYKPRVADQTLQALLSTMGAVLIEGPKACGKTTTARQFAKSSLMLGSPRARANASAMLAMQPTLVLSGETPRLFDEWQVLPSLWDEVRAEVDARGLKGQFLLTGSAVPADRSQIQHTGTGRFAWLKLRTMSSFESGDSRGEVGLRALFEGSVGVAQPCRTDIEAIAFLACRGGWPDVVERNDDASLEYVYQYVTAVAQNDVSRVDGIRRDPERVRAVLRSYARRLGTQATLSVIRSDLVNDTDETFSAKTLSTYIDALKSIFVLEDMKAWNPNLRSQTAVRTSDTRYFTDPSIAAAALGIGPKDLLSDLETFGFVFENLCIRDLRVYADALHGSVYHYRDKSGLECDAVVHRRDGSYGLVEIKLGGSEAIEHGAETLRDLRDKIDTTKMPGPSFLMVLTAVSDYVYRRRDGVWVVPVTCLGP